MLKCPKCKRQTGKKEPTGLFKTYKKWVDEKGKERKDIVKGIKVCIDCAK